MSLVTPGSGSVTPVVVGGGTVLGAATVLPQTGVNVINDLALSLAAGLIVWAVIYLKMRRAS